MSGAGQGAGVGRAGALTLALYAPLALACDVCTPRVRAAIFDGHFAGRAALTLLPLAVVLLLVALIIRGPGWLRRRDPWSS